MVNIRMRASRQIAGDKGQQIIGEKRLSRSLRHMPAARYANPDRNAPNDEHISGAEGMYSKNRMRAIVQSYLDRARNHPKGKPDRIQITIEKLTQRPKLISSLPLVTLTCTSPSEADRGIRRLLSLSGISCAALKAAFSVVRNKTCMRGAALVYARSGRRVEPNRKRGIRASRLGITGGAEVLLSRELEKIALNTQAVKEALVLASKVAAYPDIIAELCISDDPDYTTGYVASKDLGYIRIPHIKKKKTAAGGRVFFLRESAAIPAVVRYLERIPVLVASLSPCRATHTIHEIIDHHYR